MNRLGKLFPEDNAEEYFQEAFAELLQKLSALRHRDPTRAAMKVSEEMRRFKRRHEGERLLSGERYELGRGRVVELRDMLNNAFPPGDVLRAAVMFAMNRDFPDPLILDIRALGRRLSQPAYQGIPRERQPFRFHEIARELRLFKTIYGDGASVVSLLKKELDKEMSSTEYYDYLYAFGEVFPGAHGGPRLDPEGLYGHAAAGLEHLDRDKALEFLKAWKAELGADEERARKLKDAVDTRYGPNHARHEELMELFNKAFPRLWHGYTGINLQHTIEDVAGNLWECQFPVMLSRLMGFESYVKDRTGWDLNSAEVGALKDELDRLYPPEHAKHENVMLAFQNWRPSVRRGYQVERRSVEQQMVHLLEKMHWKPEVRYFFEITSTY